MKGMGIMFIVMLLSLVVAGLWQSIPFVKDTVHAALNPTAGVLLNWNIDIGMVILSAIITLITTLLQKYMTDQDAIKTIKEEQKIIQQEMKLAREHPQKQMELSKKSMELTFKAMPLTMRPLVYTVIPFVLFLRWFQDYFTAIGDPRIFGFFTWFWAYLVFSIVLSMIFRKMFNVQ